jgi:hypothetical protein
MTIYQIKDSQGNVRLEYLSKDKAYNICDAMNAMSGSGHSTGVAMGGKYNTYHVETKGNL